MKPVLIAGTSLVNIALISYSVYIFHERKTKLATKKVLIFLTAGVFFDIIATICMIAGSSQGAFTLHGIIGYSSLLGMVTDAFFTWKIRVKNGIGTPIPASLHKYSLVAYIWWIVAYLTGIVLVMIR